MNEEQKRYMRLRRKQADVDRAFWAMCVLTVATPLTSTVNKVLAVSFFVGALFIWLAERRLTKLLDALDAPTEENGK